MFLVKFVFIYFILSEGLNDGTCRAVFKVPSVPTPSELSYMKRFGYLPTAQGDVAFVYTPQSISEAVSTLQRFAGIPQTGELDEPTRKLFVKQRCGNKDMEETPSGPTRHRRYVVQQSWNKKVITYRVINGSSTLGKDRVEHLMARGLAMWAVHGQLTFVKLDTGKADIEVSFTSGDHGDGFPFDGLGRIMAHAFSPPHGDMHFDDDELWAEELADEDAEEDATDFLAVAAHEIGHALGLAHSPVRTSVMYPYYQPMPIELSEDDIRGMRELYLQESSSGSEEIASTSGTESTLSSHSSLVPRFTQANGDQSEEEELPDLCYCNYDTIQVLRGHIYVFEEEWLWMMRNKKEIEDGYPKKFHEVFPGLPDDVAAIKTIYENIRGNIVIFSGRNYWEYDKKFNLLETGNLDKFKIPPYVTELTTTFLSNHNNKTYLIADERFWRYDETSSTLDPGYPKSMSIWRNITYPVDAAIIWEGDTYFFRGAQFWRFDNTLVAAHEFYPVSTAQVWFSCPLDVDHFTDED